MAASFPLPSHPAAASLWRAADVVRLDERAVDRAPVIDDAALLRVAPDLDVWDAWPLQEVDGRPALLPDGDQLWMALGAPRFDDPDERHGHARIHLLRRTGDDFADLGPLLPDGFAPGSREWSGSAVLASDRRTVTLYFTAAGRRGEAAIGFLQRLFVATGTLVPGDAPAIRDWRDLTEIAVRDPAFYMDTDGGSGAPGTIKAFRDPGYFRDPADGAHYLFFAGSVAGSTSAFNGAVGFCVAEPEEPRAWRLMPPTLLADGLNNELERPHVVHHDGLYYLFWSTQRHVFAPDGPAGPTGLYGMVGERPTGPWRPLNGSGLVFANPAEAAGQAYSWWVMPDLSVTSFADAAGSTRRFAGTFAPFLRLRLDGDRAGLAHRQGKK